MSTGTEDGAPVSDDSELPGGGEPTGDLLRDLARAPDVAPEELQPSPARFRAGDQLAGRFEILASLGAGGMGEVYRARDQRLAREVAIKVLPATVPREAERLRRFEQEARASGALNHPHIVALYDVGSHEGSPYLVLELLAGETLRARLGRERLGEAAAVRFAAQIAEGLGAAHEAGLVHRDLKPENLFVTRDERIKILDFGLVKLRRAEPTGPGGSFGTEIGQLLGTTAYMSPEQLRGDAIDHRSDLFAFGAVLFEMLTGGRAFGGASAAETSSAILRDDPLATPIGVTPRLEAILKRCLDKRPERRFQSARDLAFALESLAPRSGRAGRALRVALAALAVGAVATAGWLGARASSRPGESGSWAGAGWAAGSAAASAAAVSPAQPSFVRLTFRRGHVQSARFSPNGETIVYSASWGGAPSEVLTTHAGGIESRSLGLGNAEILSVARGGEMALKLATRPGSVWGFYQLGRLARAPLAGGVPRELAPEVVEADWFPDGETLAVVRETPGAWRLEAPSGKLLFETRGWISHARVSPAGDRIAFIDHPPASGDAGSIVLIDLAGKRTELTHRFASAFGLAWSPSGDEIWFTATQQEGSRELRAVTLDGHERSIYRAPAALVLHDIARDGRLLLSRVDVACRMLGLAPGATRERDLSWFDGSTPGSLAADGSFIAFTEAWFAGGADYSVWVRELSGAPAVKIGEGLADDLSTDRRTVLVKRRSGEFVLVPTGAGDKRTVAFTGVRPVIGALTLDGEGIVFTGAAEGGALRLWRGTLAGGKPEALSELELATGYSLTLSPDGKIVAAVDSEAHVRLFPLRGGGPAPIVPGIEPGEWALRFSTDGRSIYVARILGLPVIVTAVELATGRRHPLHSLAPADPSGVYGVSSLKIAPDGRSYVYGFAHTLAELYLVDGLL